MVKEFTNESRNRYYGVRVGDTVQHTCHVTGYTRTGIVKKYGFMDNNCVFVQWKGTARLSKMCPEHLTIIKKVEDK